MAVQFKVSGTPLFKTVDIVAMDPNCCCGGCIFVIYQDNCQLFWYVTTSSTDFTVDITGPVGSDDRSYNNLLSGVFDNPTEGLWLGVVTLHDIDGGCLDSAEYDAPTDPCLPCCRKTVGVNFTVHADHNTFEESRQKVIAGPVYERLYTIWDLSEFHYDGYRIGSMISGSKTADDCYTRWGATEEFTIGQATFTWYTSIPHTNGDPVCVGIPADNYIRQIIYYDIIVRFNVTSSPEYLVLLKVTGEDWTFSGTVQPGGTNPSAPVIGAEWILINSGALGSMKTISWGACHHINHTTTVGAADYTDCVNTGGITMKIWPDIVLP